MALDQAFYEEFTKLTKNQNAHGDYIRNLLLFRLCKAVEALKVEPEEIEPAEVMFRNDTGSTGWPK